MGNGGVGLVGKCEWGEEGEVVERCRITVISIFIHLSIYHSSSVVVRLPLTQFLNHLSFHLSYPLCLDKSAVSNIIIISL